MPKEGFAVVTIPAELHRKIMAISKISGLTMPKIIEKAIESITPKTETLRLILENLKSLETSLEKLLQDLEKRD